MDDRIEKDLHRLVRSLPSPHVGAFDPEDGYRDGLTDEEFSLDRTLRSISLIARGAIERLESLGWNPGSIRLHIPSDNPLPCWVMLRSKRLYEIRLVPYEDGRICVQGEWIGPVPTRGILDQMLGR